MFNSLCEAAYHLTYKSHFRQYQIQANESLILADDSPRQINGRQSIIETVILTLYREFVNESLMLPIKSASTELATVGESDFRHLHFQGTHGTIDICRLTTGSARAARATHVTKRRRRRYSSFLVLFIIIDDIFAGLTQHSLIYELLFYYLPCLPYLH